MTTPGLQEETRPHTLRDLAFYFLRLGTTGFGGPIALVGYMERDLVEERRWLGREEYLRGLALAQLAPGPLAAQLAIYIGYLKGRIAGATLIGIAFILPSFLMVVALGMLYQSYGGLAWMQDLFYGIGAAVIAIIARSAYKLTKLTLKRKGLLWGIFLSMGLVTAYAQQEIAWLVLLSGLVTMVAYAPPRFLNRAGRSSGLLFTPAASLLLQNLTAAEPGILVKIFLFFGKAGAFVFGSGLAIVPFLFAGVLQQ